MNLDAIQAALRARSLDAWLFYDHHHRDPIAYHILNLPTDGMVTRRWYYLIPARGTPRKLVHRIESGVLDSLPGEKHVYSSWEELQAHLRDLTSSLPRIAMQYSANNMIPYIGIVDAGTVELLRSFGPKIVTSADLVAQFEATWDERALQSHREAGRVIDAAIQAAFQEIRRFLNSGVEPTETDIQQFLLNTMTSGGLDAAPPIVAVNANTGNPHYEPVPGKSARIRNNDVVLFDVWGKCKYPGAVYYDVTWMGFTGTHPTKRMGQVFGTVRSARDETIAFVQSAVKAGQIIRGFEVDRVARGVIQSAGMGEYFVHRTGHSIGVEVHANGANIDSLETRDERQILPHSCFSIEPGIYLPEFGVRLEVDMYVGDGTAEVTGPIQHEFVRI